VTADGTVLLVSGAENPDLFWGLRGGGGNFGVVSEFEFRLAPLGPLVLAAGIWYQSSVAGELARFYRDFMAEAPDEVGGGLRLLTAPSAEFVPHEHQGRPACQLCVIYFGDPDDGLEVARPLLDWGRPWARLVAPAPYVEVQRVSDGRHRWGIREYSRVDYLPEVPDEAIDALVDAAARAGSPRSTVMLCRLGGAASRLDRAGVALNTPDTRWMYYCVADWKEPSEDTEHIGWARGLMQRMRSWSTGVAPANFIELDEGAARLRAYYGEEKFARLVALKDTYDPLNVFALNQNIRPSGRPRAAGLSATR
jgi:FAD/FMN-containing dehydrogenase